jgi:hypothetical protein
MRLRTRPHVSVSCSEPLSSELYATKKIPLFYDQLRSHPTFGTYLESTSKLNSVLGELGFSQEEVGDTSAWMQFRVASDFQFIVCSMGTLTEMQIAAWTRIAPILDKSVVSALSALVTLEPWENPAEVDADDFYLTEVVIESERSFSLSFFGERYSNQYHEYFNAAYCDDELIKCEWTS